MESKRSKLIETNSKFVVARGGGWNVGWVNVV